MWTFRKVEVSQNRWWMLICVAFNLNTQVQTCTATPACITSPISVKNNCSLLFIFLKIDWTCLKQYLQIILVETRDQITFITQIKIKTKLSRVCLFGSTSTISLNRWSWWSKLEFWNRQISVRNFIQMMHNVYRNVSSSDLIVWLLNYVTWSMCACRCSDGLHCTCIMLIN